LDDTRQSNHSAIIIGVILGAIILISVIVAGLYCIRKRKRTKIYGARYPSLDVGSDMSKHLDGKFRRRM
jgi:Ca2+/Na+ antiporter